MDRNAINYKHSMASIDPLTLSVKAAQEKKISDSRDFFEQLVTDFPSCGKFWRIYIEQELKYRNFERVEKLFQRSLIKVLNIDLWKCYLNYVRDIKSKMSNYKEKTAQAYDFALDKIGLDVGSYSIWVDYINFLKSVEATGSFAENQKITAIRKVFQKGIMNPMMNVEQLWKDYCAFENQINPIIAKRMIEDHSRGFMMVRKISKEYENVTRSLERNAPAYQPTGSIEELKQKLLWKKYIEWEKSNPLKSEDLAQVAKRVMFAYEQCILSMATHPDIYFEAVNYLQQMSNIMTEKSDSAMAKFYLNETVSLYEKAINSFMKHNMLIYLSYVDFEENRLNYAKVNEIFNKYLEIKELDPSLCYIQFMRFLRRVEGIRSARTVFKRAREDSRVSYHVYVAAAFMEYFCTKDKTISYKIFQLGCKMFGHIPEYIMAFIEFVTHINEDDKIRGLFENVIESKKVPKEKMGGIWSEWIELENNIGSLDDILKVEDKRIESSEELQERQTLFLIDRYKFLNLFPCKPNELRSVGYTDSNSSMIFSSSLIPQGLTTGSNLATHLAMTNASVASGLHSTNPRDNLSLSKHNSDDMNSSRQQQIPKIILKSINPFNSTSRFVRIRLPCPDEAKMYAFKPSRDAFSGGLVPLPGGGPFLFPSCLAELIKRLPPPSSFDGPFVNIDEFLVLFKSLYLPDNFQLFYNQVKYQQANKNGFDKGLKRPLANQQNSDVEEDNVSKNNGKTKSQEESSMMDIYKQRQQKKLVKQS